MKLNFCYTKLTTLSVVLNKLRRCYLTVADCGDKKYCGPHNFPSVFDPIVRCIELSQTSEWMGTVQMPPPSFARQEPVLSLFILGPSLGLCLYVFS